MWLDEALNVDTLGDLARMGLARLERPQIRTAAMRQRGDFVHVCWDQIPHEPLSAELLICPKCRADEALMSKCTLCKGTGTVMLP